MKHSRRIQYVAGTTFSISLPKKWVQQHKLHAKDELQILEKEDGTLLLSPRITKEHGKDKISLCVDDYMQAIGQILFAVYYAGFENIYLFSRSKIAKETKATIRKTLIYMSGTEISFEDEKTIHVRVLLDKSKIDIIQLLYRICLLIELSISNLIENPDVEELTLHENEIDRLYHLLTKTVSLALTNTDVLATSKIHHISLIPSYFLISKRLENIMDNLYSIGLYLKQQHPKINYKEVLLFTKQRLGKCIKHLLQDFPGVFVKVCPQEVNAMLVHLHKIKNTTIFDYLQDIVRFTIDIEEEVVNLSFYHQLLRMGEL